MMNGFRNRMIGGVVVVLTAAVCGTVTAQDYPSKRVTVITSIPAGSATDMECRGAIQFVAAAWNRIFVIESRPGAGGSIAAAAVAKAAPDGHTLFCSGPGLTTFKLMIKDLPFDPMKDLVPISNIADFAAVFVTNTQSLFKTIDEFIEYAKANPGKLNYGSAGKNSTVFPYEAMKRDLRLNIVEIPYTTTPLIVEAVARNDVQIGYAPVSVARGMIDSGKVRPVLVYGSRRLAVYPTVPTPAEKNLNLPMPLWTGLFAPAGTPRAIIDRLAAEVSNYAQSAPMKQREAAGQVFAVGSTPEQFRQQVENDARMATEIANRLGWKPE